jgi:hypothetical protein
MVARTLAVLLWDTDNDKKERRKKDLPHGVSHDRIPVKWTSLEKADTT